MNYETWKVIKDQFVNARYRTDSWTVDNLCSRLNIDEQAFWDEWLKLELDACEARYCQ